MSIHTTSTAAINPAAEKPWHTLTIEDTVVRLQSRFDGLSDAEATLRLKEFGPNELQAGTRISASTILLEQFRTYSSSFSCWRLRFPLSWVTA
jgi:hypothetical protein